MGSGPDRYEMRATSLVHYEVAARRLVLPDTSLDLTWVDGEIDVIGPMSVARPSRYAIGARVLLLSLEPVTGAAWLGIPLNALTDRVVRLKDVSGARANWLEARFEAGTAGDLVGAGAQDGSRATVAMRALARGARVAAVAAHLNLSERHLTRSFHEHLGLHPKRFQRIARLRHAVAQAKAGLSLAEAAIAGGYADQAHFTREVRALTGATPVRFSPMSEMFKT